MSWLAAAKRPLPAFAAASFPAVATGAVVCALSGVPAGLWGRNLAAWLVGGLAAGALGRWAGASTLRVVALLAPLAVAASLFAQGQAGVHRWLSMGPLSINAAMLLLPAFVVALVVLPQGSPWIWIPALLTVGVLVLQPDASQATALALALGVAALGARTQPTALRWGLAVAATALAALAWTRPDPLQPVAEVEGVIGLAGHLSPWLAALAILSLVAFAATPAMVTLRSPVEAVRWAGRALSVLLLAWCAAPALGAFPVPLVGIGLSPILGAWLGVGALAAAARREGAADTSS